MGPLQRWWDAQPRSRQSAYSVGGLAAVLLRGVDAVVRRDVADDRFCQIVNDRQGDAVVAIDVAGRAPRKQQGEQRDAERVVGDGAFIGRCARAQGELRAPMQIHFMNTVARPPG